MANIVLLGQVQFHGNSLTHGDRWVQLSILFLEYYSGYQTDVGLC